MTSFPLQYHSTFIFGSPTGIRVHSNLTGCPSFTPLALGCVIKYGALGLVDEYTSSTSDDSSTFGTTLNVGSSRELQHH